MSAIRTGYATTGLGKHERGYVVAIAPDGKIVVGGESSDEEWGGGGPSSRFAVARYNTNGTLDHSFDHDGKTTTDFPGGARINALAFQNDGKLIAAGSSNYRMALARYGADGSLDGSFGNGMGKFVTNAATGANAVVATREGILTIGKSNSDLALVRFDFSGAPDASFGAGGKVATDFGGNESAMTLRLQPDGKIVVAGKKDSASFVVSRYLNAAPHVTVASLDRTTFEGGGSSDTMDRAASAGRDRAHDDGPAQPRGRRLCNGGPLLPRRGHL